MENKLGQGLAVGLTAICCAIIGSVGIIYTNSAECLLVMFVPVGVTFIITIGDGWD